MTRPRLLLWSPLPPPSGGIASWTARLLESSLTERYDVRVVNTNQSGSDRGGRLRQVRRTGGIGARWAAQCARWRPDVVHVNTSGRWPGFLKEAAALEVARAAGARTVLHFRGKGPQFLFDHRSFRALGQPLLQRPDRVLVLNREALDFARTHGRPDTEQVTGFVVHRPMPEREPPDGERRLRLVYVGWMIRAKGVFELLDAVRAVPDVELTMVGRYIRIDGETIEDELDQLLAADPELAARVHRLGEVPPERVWQELDRADVFVLPSWSEGFPNALLEAMMAGLPCVVTPAGAMPEAVVDGETGLVVPMRDADGLAQAFRWFIESPERLRTLGRAAYRRVTENYERDAVAHRLADLYDGLLGTSTRSS